MAALPAPKSQTVQAIYSWWAGKLEHPRAYLGGSVIGQECERRLWYAFRWCQPPGQEFDGRMRRLFDRGHREEAVFVAELRGIGCQVHDVDPSTGQQFRFKAVGGHFGGGIDAVALGVPEAPKTWHLVEMKTHNAKSFAALVKDGVAKAKPEHYAQMQVYMHLASLTRALYLAVNKDTDELHAERIRYSEAEALALMEKAQRVIFLAEPPTRLNEDPAFFKCKFCPASPVCHGTALPPVSCRTCLHATPEPDGDGRWSCARFGCDVTTETQRAAGEQCPDHRYIPALLARWGEAVDASEAENWVEYRAPDGLTFRNGPWGPGSYTSRELAQASPGLLRDEQFLALRAKYEGRVVEYKEAA